MESENREQDTRVFFTLGYSNWTILSLLGRFCHTIFISFFPLAHNTPIIHTVGTEKQGEREKGRKEGRSNATLTLASSIILPHLSLALLGELPIFLVCLSLLTPKPATWPQSLPMCMTVAALSNIV